MIPQNICMSAYSGTNQSNGADCSTMKQIHTAFISLLIPKSRVGHWGSGYDLALDSTTACDSLLLVSFVPLDCLS